jgi:thiol-disulfide isomerase/thioredoxin
VAQNSEAKQQGSAEEKKGVLRSDQNQLMGQQGFSFSGYERDPLFLNLGKRKFMDISGASGIDSISDGRAAVFADLDNDGDYDVFMTTIQGQAHLLFRNQVGQSNKFIRVSLEGTKSGRDAFGSVVRMKTTAGTLTKLKSGGSGYLAQHDPRLIFGFGENDRVDAIEVTWPAGTVETFGAASAGSSVLLREGSGGEAKAGILLTEARTNLPDPLTRVAAVLQGLKIKLGQALPEVKLTTLSGRPSTLAAQLKPGRRTLVNLWATWCVPCAREMPELQRLSPDLAKAGIDLIGLNIDAEPSADVKGYLARRKVSYIVLVGGIPAIEAIYATEELSVPLSLILDDKGKVLEVLPGWSADTQRRLAALIATP